MSAGVLRRLAQFFDAAPAPPSGAPHVLAGLARGSRHELGILAFAAVLRHHGVRVTYLGADLPVEAWLATVRRVAPDALVVGVPLAEDLPAVRELISALAGPDSPPLVGLGGAQQDRVGSGVPLGHSVGEAAAGLTARLRGPAG